MKLTKDTLIEGQIFKEGIEVEVVQEGIESNILDLVNDLYEGVDELKKELGVGIELLDKANEGNSKFISDMIMLMKDKDTTKEDVLEMLESDDFYGKGKNKYAIDMSVDEMAEVADHLDNILDYNSTLEKAINKLRSLAFDLERASL